MSFGCLRPYPSLSDVKIFLPFPLLLQSEYLERSHGVGELPLSGARALLHCLERAFSKVSALRHSLCADTVEQTKLFRMRALSVAIILPCPIAVACRTWNAFWKVSVLGLLLWEDNVGSAFSECVR